MRAPPHDSKARQHPGWLLKIIEAKRRAFDALSDAEKAEALDVQKERRQRVRAKRAASLSLATQIFKLHDAGHTADEIAAIIGRRPISVVQFAASRGVFVSRVHAGRAPRRSAHERAGGRAAPHGGGLRQGRPRSAR